MHDPFNKPELRPDLPTYPVHIQLIRVTEATVPGPTGVAQIAGSSFLAPPLYVGYVQQLHTGTLIPRDREPCLVADVNGLGVPQFPGGTHARYFLGRLTGIWAGLPVYEIATTSPVYVGYTGITVEDDDGIPSFINTNVLQFDQDTSFLIDHPANNTTRIKLKAQVIRGKLDSNLTFGGSSQMSVWIWNGSSNVDTGENETVYDWLLSSGQTILTGVNVMAAWDQRSSRYYVIGAQCA